MAFPGFTEDDIRKLTINPADLKRQKTGSVGAVKSNTKKVTFKPNSTINPPKPRNNLNNNSSNVTIEELPEDAKLSTLNQTDDNNKQSANNEEITKEIIEENNESTEKRVIDLEQFEAKHKLIEEQNRKRKELLSKALADRTKQTREEAARLNEIQEEFKKLDFMLSGDVKILRKEIELASVEYMECQKRYQKIEKEFTEAKLQLHQKLERKEMLTEHLCTIIEKNEERKAEKLNELLHKLELNTATNGVKMPEDLSAI